jgi:nitrogen fixation protein NifU and related proteins
MTKDSFYLIQQDLQFHAKNPLNFGLPQNLDFISNEHNPSCGDSVIVGGQMHENGTLEKLFFQGSGCVMSMAMASKLTKAVVGMNVSEILSLDESFVEQLLGLQLGPNRLKCGLLSVIALKKGVGLYENRLKI